MQKAIGKVYDTTSATAGTLSPSFSNLETVDALIVYVIASGAAAPGALAVTAGDVRDATVSAIYDSLPAPGAGSSVVYSLGPGGYTANASILPSKLSFSVTAGAASTVRLIIYAVRMI